MTFCAFSSLLCNDADGSPDDVMCAVQRVVRADPRVIGPIVYRPATAPWRRLTFSGGMPIVFATQWMVDR